MLPFKDYFNYYLTSQYNFYNTEIYAIEYKKLFIFFLIAALICSLLIIISFIFSLNTIKDNEKLSEYECGFEPFDNATRHPFDVHFYVVGILFLIFDVEIALIFPWILGLNLDNYFSFYIMLLFLFIITVGFFFEWHRGALTWPHKTEFIKTIQSISPILIISSNIEFIDITTFFNTPFHISFIYFSPEIYLGLSCLVILLLISMYYFKAIDKSFFNSQLFSINLLNLIIKIFIIIICLQFLLLIINPTININIFFDYLIYNFYTVIFKIIVLLTGLFILINSKYYITYNVKNSVEYSFMITLTIFFLMIMISSSSLLLMFICILGFSLNVYTLIMYNAPAQPALEAAVKYFYLSAISSGLIANGLLLTYLTLFWNKFWLISFTLHKITHELDYALWDWTLGTIAILSLIYGFLFKLAAFPCHLWAPEIYEGSSNPIMALFVLPLKIGTFAIFLKLLTAVFKDVYFIWSFTIWFSSIMSMIWGCLGAYMENNIRKFIAYSSINQMGFIFIGLISSGFNGVQATIMYLLIYIFMNWGFLQIYLTLFNNVTGNQVNYITQFKYFANKNWIYSIGLAIILFSMAGIPPLAGFFGKYFLFTIAFESEYFLVILVGLATSLVSTFYYLRIIKIMWFETTSNFTFIKTPLTLIVQMNIYQRIGFYISILLLTTFIFITKPLYTLTYFMTICSQQI